jgi:hypothetical protein
MHFQTPPQALRKRFNLGNTSIFSLLLAES